MNLLIIEDEPRIASFLQRGLETEGFRVSVARDGIDGLQRATSEGYDLIILDLILPRMSGEEVLSELRASAVTTPVIILSAKDAIPDRVVNLNAGADDYLTKPFSFAELVARIRVRLRNTGQTDPIVLRAGPVTLDLRRHEASVDGRAVRLTPREFTMLETFMRHPGAVLSQVQLLDQVWGYDYDPESNVVEVYVGYLRRKLGPDLIETIRGAGYRLRT